MKDLQAALMGVIGGWSPQSFPFRGLVKSWLMARACSPKSLEDLNMFRISLEEIKKKNKFI